MESVLGAICAVAGIFGLPMVLLWLRVTRLTEKIDRLERQLAGTDTPRPTFPSTADLPRQSAAPVTQTQERPPIQTPRTVEATVSSPATAPAPARPAAPTGPSRWKILEAKFAENWTGILGAVILVTGIGFLGVYAALHVTPLLRFIMINVIGAALFAAYWFFRSRHALGQFSLWLRSASGAVVLFAAVGAIFIPGIKWTEGDVQGLAVLIPAIVFNLACGLLGGSQIFASLHVVLSLAALATAPQGTATLLVGGSVVFVSLFYSYPLRREPHTIVTLASYFVYHLYWRSTFAEAPALPDPAAVGALSILVLTGLAAVLLHYREVYRSPTFKTLSFLTHLASWFYLGNAALIYATGSKWAVVPLAAAAVVVFLLADRARRQGIHWLYATDTLVAQGLATAACLFLLKWEMGTQYVWTLIAAECLLFTALTIRQGSKIVTAVSLYLFYAAMLIAQAAGAAHSEDHLLLSWYFTGGLFAFGLLASAWLYRTRARNAEVFSAFANPERALGLSGIFPGLSILYMASLNSPGAPPAWLILPAVVLLLLLRARLETIGLLAGAAFAVLILLIIHWLQLSDLPVESGWLGFLHATAPDVLMLVLVFLFSRFKQNGPYITIPGAALLLLQTLITGYYAFDRLSPFAYSSFVILLGLVVLELGRRATSPGLGGVLARLHRMIRMPGHESGVTDPLPTALEIGSWILAFIFIRSHVLVDMQWERSFGPIHGRFGIELFALVVFLYQALFFSKGRPDNAKESLLDRLSPLRWETFLTFLVFSGLAELPDRFYPVLFSVLSLALLYAGKRAADLSRLRLYALVSSIAACFNIAFVSTSGVTPSALWSHQPWIGAAGALITQFVFAAVFYRYADLSGVQFPGILRSWSALPARAGTKIRLVLFYPIFIATALFLWWSFDKSILTLLWVAESFAIFLLALFLGMNHFRILSTIALGACLVRLIAFDMAQASYVVRAVVFVGVGLMMLTMNALYARFRTRFQK